MGKLREYLERWTSGKRVQGFQISPYEVELLVLIYNEIKHGIKSEFISENVRNVLDKCGIKTESVGIGWRVI